MKSYLTIISGILCLTTRILYQPHAERLFHAVFKEWNQSTIAFINREAKRAQYADWRSAYRKREKIVQSLLNSPTANDSDEIDKGQPARYKFLKQIHVDSIINKHFFIIETTLSAEVAQSRSYLIENSALGSHIRVYMYFNNRWKMKRDTIVPKIDLRSEIETHETNISVNGVNLTDVILTEFNSSKIRSIYHLAGSIPKNDCLIRIANF